MVWATVDSASLSSVTTSLTFIRTFQHDVRTTREQNVPAVSGDASDPAVLIQAHVARARLLIVAIPDAAGVRKMVETAETLNPKLEILLRTHTDEEARLLRKDNLGTVFMGEHELAIAIARHAMIRLGVTDDASEYEEPIMSRTKSRLRLPPYAFEDASEEDRSPPVWQS